ncbi:M50 family metallopeptidase [Colwellia sp. E2M01]|uniref:M50 family metallopeptidase n=1 Tax=Colwellia sp. E2M01 TaxID=2841561 RepID=UPI001C09054F|nr:M50 family metallopeptidase [Colwellia sp. E2M01]MBU2869347.1 M50 family metallopeptidase [Colwellia sp. E2M01]
MANNSQITSASFWQKYQLYFLLIAAVVIRQIPIVSIPLNWLETYFHEISHGIAALLTGGEIISIQLFSNGSGLCTTRGGIGFFITFFGYAGATLWGWLLFKLAKSHQRTAQIISALMIALLVASIILWARDLLTIIIIVCLVIIFIFTIKVRRLHYLQLLLKFFGLSILLNSLFSPIYLFDGRALGDGAALASMTFIPEFIWVIIWCVIALAALYSLIKSNK